MTDLPDPDWYVDNVLIHATPGRSGIARGAAADWTSWWSQRHGGDLVARGAGFVLSAAELAAADVPRQRVRTRVRRGEWVAAGHGFVAPVDIRDTDEHTTARRRHAVQAAASARRRPGHAISGRSAAILSGLPTFRIPERPELTSSDSVGLGRRRSASHVYGAGLHVDECTTWFGVTVTSVARTLVDLARHDRWDAIMAADAALRENLVVLRDLDAALTAAIGWPGVRQARALLPLASAESESALESLTRLRLHDDGFPVPKLQVWIGQDRVDMLFEEARLILEVDGLLKYRDDALRREKLRETRLRRMGYRVERVTWADVVTHWPRTSAWLRGILRLPA